MHDYLSKAKSSNLHYFVLSIGTVRGKPMTSSGRWRKSGASSLIQYTVELTGTELAHQTRAAVARGIS